jgi:hypothetical protein
MDKIEQQISRVNSLNIWDIILKELEVNSSLIVEMNKIQLLKGKTSKGENITPTYFDDDYFKSRGQAVGYAVFKSKLDRNPYFAEKGFGTPDFFIKGTLVHDMLTAEIVGDEFIIEPKGKGASFDEKWKDIYGIDDENLGIIREKIFPEMMKAIRKHLGYD